MADYTLGSPDLLMMKVLIESAYEVVDLFSTKYCNFFLQF